MVKLLAFFSVLFFLSEGRAFADTIVLQQGVNGYNGTRDTTIYQELGNNSAGGFPYLYAGVTRTGDIRRTLIAFDVSAIPVGSVVNTATVQLHSEYSRPGSIACALHKLTRDWNEGSNPLPIPDNEGGQGAPAQAGDTTWSFVSYNTMDWVTPGGEFMTLPSGTGTIGPAPVDVVITGSGLAADVQEWVNNSEVNYGWILLAGEDTSWNARRMYSSEATAPEKPFLAIDYTPPSTVHDWILY